MNVGFEIDFFPAGQVWTYQKGRETNRPAWSLRLVKFLNYVSIFEAILTVATICWCLYNSQVFHGLFSLIVGIVLNIIVDFSRDYFKLQHVYLIPRHVFMEALEKESLNHWRFEQISRFHEHHRFHTNHLIKVNVACLRFHRYTFISHRWESKDLPDTLDGRQSRLMKEKLDQSLVDRFVSNHLLSNSNMRDKQTETFFLLLNWLDFIGVLDAVWVDHMCVPQDKDEVSRQDQLEQIGLFRVIAENSSGSLIVPKKEESFTSESKGTEVDVNAFSREKHILSISKESCSELSALKKMDEIKNVQMQQEGDFKDYISRGWCLLEYLFLHNYNRKILWKAKSEGNPDNNTENAVNAVLCKISPILLSDAYDPKIASGLWDEGNLSVGDDKDRGVLEFNLRDRLRLTQRIRRWWVLAIKIVFNPLRYLICLAIIPSIVVLTNFLNSVWRWSGYWFTQYRFNRWKYLVFFIYSLFYAICVILLGSLYCSTVFLDALARELIMRIMKALTHLFLVPIHVFRTSLTDSVGFDWRTEAEKMNSEIQMLKNQEKQSEIEKGNAIDRLKLLESEEGLADLKEKERKNIERLESRISKKHERLQKIASEINIAEEQSTCC